MHAGAEEEEEEEDEDEEEEEDEDEDEEETAGAGSRYDEGRQGEGQSRKASCAEKPSCCGSEVSGQPSLDCAIRDSRSKGSSAPPAGSGESEGLLVVRSRKAPLSPGRLLWGRGMRYGSGGAGGGVGAG